MMRLLRNKKGFSLVEIVTALIITSVALSAVVSYFDLYNSSISIRMKSFLSKNETNNMETVRNAIKEGTFVHGETRIPNTEISNHKIAISTSYFSNDYNNPNIYVLECSPKEDGTGTLTSYIREDLSQDNAQTRILSNKVKKCSFTAYDSSGNATIDTRQAIKLVLDYSYYADGKNMDLKNIHIVTKMMQG